MSFTASLSKLFKIWICFLLGLNILTYLPHFPLHFLSWLNYSLYFLLGVLAIFVSRRDKYMGDIFVLFSISFLVITLTVLVYFVGDEYLVGDYITFYCLFFYSRALFYMLLAISVLYLVLRYLIWNMSKWIIFLIALGTVIFIEHDLIINIINNYQYARELGKAGILLNALKMDVLCVTALLIYLLFLLASNRPSGAFMSFWVVSLFILFLIDLFDTIVSFHEINLYGVDQYFAIGALIAMLVALFFRFASLYSESHILREQLIFDSRYSLSTPIMIKDSQNSVVLQQIKSIFNNKKYVIQGVIAASVILLAGLTNDLILIIKIIMLSVLIFIIWNVYNYMFRVKANKGQILNQKFLNKSRYKSIFKKIL